jgi:peptidyl-tRNA hydrolase, PTH2 family
MKQIIVIRKDLNMRRGKQIAQGAHASMAAVIQNGQLKEDPRIKEWLDGLFTKICVSVDSEDALEEVYQKAKDAGMLTSYIVDSGLTEFNGVPTATAVGIGPDTHENLLPITGSLKLL